ncbi:uncharacterized protein LOC135461611 [Liolophura sinensis]|uniref:uncharacterized protein LOC135461611 n=1 Tax=Liolophura sinensis TaxID=3198878 RepID=UPI0031587270
MVKGENIYRVLLSCGLAFLATTSCVFVVRSLHQDNGLLDRQLTQAKKSLMENTNWKLDTYVIYKTFDGDGDGKLTKNDLTAMMLVAAMDRKQAEATAGTLSIVGDTDWDGRLTVEEFKQLFGINS